MTLPLWIRTADDLAALAAELAGTPALAIDTEADSLHHYPGKLCLVQVADAQRRGHLVDPLVLRDLSPLGPVLADPGAAFGQEDRTAVQPERLAHSWVTPPTTIWPISSGCTASR